MKKNLSRITVIVSGAIGLIFIILLIATAFGGLLTTDYENGLVRALLFVFGGIYLTVTVTAALLQFSEHITVKEVKIAQNGGGTITVTPGVVRSLVKSNMKELEGIRFRRMQLVLTEFGVQLNVLVSYSSGRRVEETSEFLRRLIADVCKRELDLSFKTINIKVTGFQSVYIPDVKALESGVQENLGHEPIERDDSPEPVYINADSPELFPEPVETEYAKTPYTETPTTQEAAYRTPPATSPADSQTAFSVGSAQPEPVSPEPGVMPSSDVTISVSTSSSDDLDDFGSFDDPSYDAPSVELKLHTSKSEENKPEEARRTEDDTTE